MLLDLLPLFDTGGGSGGFPFTHVCGICRALLLPGEDCPECTRLARARRDERDLAVLGVL